MMVMTAKVDFKKIIIVLAVIAGIILGAILLFGGRDSATATGTAAVSNNDARVKFLTDMGWDVVTSPAESNQVRIPTQSTQVYDRYNTLQKSQGYDLTKYAGKTVMRYVYKINNFPGATEPVYATLLVYKNQIIGGDITDTSAKGAVQGFKMQASPLPEQTVPTQPTVPETT